MNPARQAREYERQKFLEELERFVDDRSDRQCRLNSDLTREKSYVELASAILKYLSYWDSKIGGPQLWYGRETSADIFLELELFPRIEKFARTANERGYLLAQLLKKVVETTTLLFCHKLSQEELQNPRAVFRAPSAMAKTALPEEEK